MQAEAGPGRPAASPRGATSASGRCSATERDADVRHRHRWLHRALIIWLLKRDEMPFVADQGRETLNFQITTLLALCVGGLLAIC